MIAMSVQKASRLVIRQDEECGSGLPQSSIDATPGSDREKDQQSASGMICACW